MRGSDDDDQDTEAMQMHDEDQWCRGFQVPDFVNLDPSHLITSHQWMQVYLVGQAGRGFISIHGKSHGEKRV